MTVLEVIQRSAEFLAKKGVESPRLQVELLLAHLLRLPRMGLYLNFERALTAKELAEVREWVRRRGQREPCQQIVGSTSFCGLELAVNSKVLVPRPETELLAELGWDFLNSLAAEKRNGKTALHERVGNPLIRPSGTFSPMGGEGRDEGAAFKGETHVESPAAPNPGTQQRPVAALDFGTGSGCLAIALAVKCSATQVVAVDVSAEALAIARENAATHEVLSRIRFVAGDGLAALTLAERFDLIVANPPYIPSHEIATLEPEVRDYDPHLALDGGADGLDFYRRLALEAGNFLHPGGRIMLEFGDGQEGEIEKLFTQQKWIVEAVKADYSGRPRILVARWTDAT